VRKPLIGLAAAIVLASSAAVASHADSTDALMSRYTGDVPGASLLVIKDGKPIMRRGYGMADMEHHVPATPATNYRLASVSKQFTAAAILLLAEDGKLKLDDPVRRWLPSLPEKYRRGHPAPFADPHRRAGRL
jgi:CubicO group peptidase (beta-lactamase class C family)